VATWLPDESYAVDATQCTNISLINTGICTMATLAPFKLIQSLKKYHSRDHLLSHHFSCLEAVMMSNPSEREIKLK
jgi:hypothetical protein